VPVSIQTNSFNVTPEEYLRLIGFRSAGPRLAIVGAIMVSYGAFATFTAGIRFALIWEAIIAVLLLVLMVTQYYVGLRSLKKPENAAAFSNRIVYIEDDMVRWVTEMGIDSKVPWNSIIFARRKSTFTLLYLTKMQCVVIRDEAFATGSDLRTFLELIPQKTKWKGKVPSLP
jgi:hypothetical protein